MSSVLISEKANPGMVSYLTSMGHTPIYIRGTSVVHEAISSHVDIYCCLIGEELVIAPEQLNLIEAQLILAGVPYLKGASDLKPAYPGDIAYNAAVTGKYFIHHLKHTDPVLLDRARNQGLTLIDAKQGYTKCNLVVVTENALITSDEGIAAQLTPYPIAVLLVQPGHVNLPGFASGFLGGASGRVDDTIIFNGNLAMHPDCKQIISFIEAHGLKVAYFQGFELEDIGSIVAL